MSSDETDGVPDGMKVDVEGRVYCTGPGGTWVFAPDGTRLGIIRTPEVPANLAFGGPDLRTLFLTARTSVYTLRVRVPGQPHPWYRRGDPRERDDDELRNVPAHAIAVGPLLAGDLRARGRAWRRPRRRSASATSGSAEHHFSTYGYLSRPLQLATYIAAKTTRLRVGTAVIVVPLHHPLVIAEEIATLDVLSGGRVDIGLGRGYQHYEFERFGLAARRRPRTLGRVDRHHPEGVRGQALHATTASSSRSPRRRSSRSPLQKPHPPIWITAQSPYVDRGGRAPRLQRAHRRLRRAGRAAGGVRQALRPRWSPRSSRRSSRCVGVQRAVYVTESDADARDAAEQARWNMRVTLSLRNNYERVENGNAIPVPAPRPSPTMDDLLDRFLVIGTPDTCIRQIKRIAGAGGHHALQLQLLVRRPRPEARAALDGAASPREVMPAFR